MALPHSTQQMHLLKIFLNYLFWQSLNLSLRWAANVLIFLVYNQMEANKWKPEVNLKKQNSI